MQLIDFRSKESSYLGRGLERLFASECTGVRSLGVPLNSSFAASESSEHLTYVRLMFGLRSAQTLTGTRVQKIIGIYKFICIYFQKKLSTLNTQHSTN